MAQPLDEPPLVGRWAPDAEGRPSLLAPSMRRRIIDVLASVPLAADGSQPGMSAQEIARTVGLHVTTARFHLDILVDAFVVESWSERRAGQVGRPRRLYRLISGRVRRRPITRELAMLVTSTWGLPEPEGSETMFPLARDWALAHAQVSPAAHPADTPGRWLVTAERVVETMEAWGFRHELSLADGGRQVDLTLTAAPFLAIAARHAPVLYAFRRGLITGVLERLGEEDVDVTLTAHDDIAVTTAHLATRTPLRHTVGPLAASAPRTVPENPQTRRRHTNRRRDA